MAQRCATCRHWVVYTERPDQGNCVFALPPWVARTVPSLRITYFFEKCDFHTPEEEASES